MEFYSILHVIAGLPVKKVYKRRHDNMTRIVNCILYKNYGLERAKCGTNFEYKTTSKRMTDRAYGF